MNKVAVLTNFLNHTVYNHRSMALWFMPQAGELCWLSQEATKKTTNDERFEIPDSTGFVFYPFNSITAKPIFLASSTYFQGFKKLAETFENSENHEIFLSEKPAHILSTVKDDYLRSLEVILQKIQSGKAQKVVLSKIKIVSEVKKKPAEIFLQLKDKYPTAFCWMLYTPETGLWAGASPEVLLIDTGNTSATMALAGSRKAVKNTQEPWPEKERREQQFVTDYILSTLKNLNIRNPEVSQPYSVSAGNIEHIRTDISFRRGKVSVDTVLSALHPTPAVCGYPKAEALKIIKESEHHQREYYTGFLGPLNMNNASHLFVNLRCMKIWRNHYQLFTGGGITAQSDPQAEWAETELKTQTMLGALEDDPKL